MLTSIEIGDRWNDGHGRYVSCLFDVNKDLNKAYEKGTELVEFDFINKVAKGYDDSELPKNYLEILKKHGYKEELCESNGVIYLAVDDYLTIYMFICKLGDPELIFTPVEVNNVDINGYGLFI